jgi:hypothetical protein
MIAVDPNEGKAHQMTSGQGGPPQNWDAPPPQQPYGEPYPGYAPAPSAPVGYGAGYGAPPAMERPTTVRAGIGALIANLVLGVIGSVVAFTDLDSMIDQAMARAAAENPEATEDLVRTGFLLGAVLGLVLIALNVLFLWFAWHGRNWARIVLWVLGGLSVVGALYGFGAGTGQSGFLASLSVFQLLLLVAGLVLLALKPSNEWYRYRGWLRATRQR